MSYTHKNDKLPTIHPDIGKFDFCEAKKKREWAYSKGVGSKEWIEFSNLMFEQFPFIYNTCLLMNDEQKELQAKLKIAVDALNEIGSANWHFSMRRKIANYALKQIEVK